MGRGRAKAKQTKVARRLKYSTPSMDLDALRQELSGSGGSTYHPPAAEDDEDDDFEYEEYDDPYADIYGDEDDADADDEGEDDGPSVGGAS
ncbi:MAG: hypothetical protein QG597_906 [Actinomycetota bacterium]|nr:hypothetical protein [Actinomycetota bacterium]